MITAIMRSLFADVFVHGTGGGKYDRFTDQLLKAWWGVEPTAITVASTSRRLFGEARAAVKRLTSIEQQLRDLMYNPQRSLGQSVFSAELEEKLRSLLAQKDVLTSEMRMARETGGSAKDAGIRMQRLTEEIRGLVQQSSPDLWLNSDRSPKITAVCWNPEPGHGSSLSGNKKTPDC